MNYSAKNKNQMVKRSELRNYFGAGTKPATNKLKLTRQGQMNQDRRIEAIPNQKCFAGDF